MKTKTAISKARSADVRVTFLQPNRMVTWCRGYPAKTAPVIPATRSIPVAKAYRSGGSQWLLSLRVVTNATATDPPIRNLATPAQKSSSDMAKKAELMAVEISPNASRRLGPQRSASKPVGICIAV